MSGNGLARRLLGRAPHRRLPLAPDAFRGAAVLVTGAGGSIGGALARRLAALPLRRLVLVESSEGPLQRLTSALQGVRAPWSAVLGDAGDPRLLEDVLGTHHPDAIVHAAAFKHVPLLETQVAAAVRNNVLAVQTLAAAAARHRVARLVLLSSDKAVNPTSVLGATKRVAELVVAAVQPPTRGTSLRLCNVLGSSGSVLPTLRARLRRGEALTITDPEASRHFLTPREAVDLLLAALRHGAGGDVLVAHPGPPVRILDLACRLRDEVGADVGIVFTGLQPGEKRAEELWSEAERPEPTSLPGLVRVACRPRVDLARVLVALREEVERRDAAALVATLREAVPEYRPAALHAQTVR